MVGQLQYIAVEYPLFAATGALYAAAMALYAAAWKSTGDDGGKNVPRSRNRPRKTSISPKRKGRE